MSLGVINLLGTAITLHWSAIECNGRFYFHKLANGTHSSMNMESWSMTWSCLNLNGLHFLYREIEFTTFSKSIRFQFYKQQNCACDMVIVDCLWDFTSMSREMVLVELWYECSITMSLFL